MASSPPPRFDSTPPSLAVTSPAPARSMANALRLIAWDLERGSLTPAAAYELLGDMRSRYDGSADRG